MSEARFYGKGEDAQVFQAGDVVLTSGSYLFSKLIRFGQGLRFNMREAHWNHACLVLDNKGDLAEALSRGVVRTNIRNYKNTDYWLISNHIPYHDQIQIMEFARSVLAAKWRYGWVTIASVILTLATGSTLVFGKSGTAICSGFVSQALVRAGYIFPKPPDNMMPADLARYFGAR